MLLLVLSLATAFTQKNTIQLIDQNTYVPINAATFNYGAQTGISDENGFISFEIRENQTMVLSHLKYGTWQWNEGQLLKFSKNGTFYRPQSRIELYPVTVLAVRAPHLSTEKVQLSYQDQMAHDATTILEQIPAFSGIRKAGNYGFDPVFRGFKYDQLNIVLDGAQSATAACPNRMDPPTSQMAPNMMESVEILKGPHALRYGTGFGATVNFLPTTLQFSSTPDVYGRLSTGFETNGDVLRTEGRLGWTNKKYDISLFGAWGQGKDYKSGDGTTIQANFERANLGTSIGWKIAGNQQLRMSAQYNLARDVDFPALPMDLRTDDTWMFNARHDITFNQPKLKAWNTTVFASLVDHLMDNRLKPLNPRMINAETSATTANYGARTEGNWQSETGRLYLGADLKVEAAEGTRTRAFLLGPNAGVSLQDNAWQDSRITKTAVFSTYHLSTNQAFQLVFSGRIELNNAQVNDPSGEFIGVNSTTKINQLNPSFSVGATRSFPTGIKLGLWLGRAQRSAGLTERFINYFPVGQDPYEMLGNPDLRPEANHQLDFNFSWNNEKTKLSVDLFGAYMQDFISSLINTNLTPRLPNSPGVRQFVNLDAAFKTGFEAAWTQSLAWGLQHQLVLAYTFAQDLERKEPLPEIAPLDFRYTLKGQYLDGKLQPEARLRYVSEQSRISTAFGETITPTFALLDLNVSYQVLAGLQVAAGVQNVFNENYYEHLARNVRSIDNPIFAQGRNFNFSVNVSF